MSKNITVTEIAKLAEVSPSTVSLVLNGKQGVGNEVREKVLKIAREHNYKGMANGALSKKNKTILFVSIVKHGQILNKNHKAFVADYINGAVTEAEENGYALEVTAFDSFDPVTLTEHINSSYASGAVILGTELEEADILHLATVKIPVVFIDVLSPHLPFDFVDMNNDSSVFNIMSYIKEMGHTSTGIVTGSYITSNFAHRMRSYERSLELLGMESDKNFVFTVNPKYEKAYEDMGKILDKKPKMPTVLFCVNDIIALGCMKALKEHGYRIPEDISIAGFDNLAMSSMAEPPLSTVKVSKKRISIAAVDLLLKRINSGERTPYEKIMIGGEVIKRESIRDMKAPQKEES
jgi:LacI family transcriptional regulator